MGIFAVIIIMFAIGFILENKPMPKWLQKFWGMM